MSDGSPDVRSIFSMPDEILVQIFLHLNARERLTLANTCTRFHILVFGDEELIRDLDFSKNGHLTTETDIQQYFGNERTCELVRKVNIQNVRNLSSGRILNDLVGRATSLVDINIHGTEFRDIEQLGSFLKPLVHVKRLSMDWMFPVGEEETVYRRILQEPFSRLTYLSVWEHNNNQNFYSTLQLCQELKELRLVMKMTGPRLGRGIPSDPTKLRNLRILQAFQNKASMPSKDELMTMLPDLHEWTDFYLGEYCGQRSLYFEKNVEACEKLAQFQHSYLQDGGVLLPHRLLRGVIKITHEDVPEEFCCLTPSPDFLNKNEGPCLLQIDDAKRLLRDPECQISFLQFNHSIASDCDAHLLASAFPNLTELVLKNIFKSKDTVATRRRKQHFQRRLRRKGSTAPEEQDDENNLDSSFKMLVENTPNVKDLTIVAVCDPDPDANAYHKWDLDALYFIPLWKNLTTLSLAHIPIKDGTFLINIGRECPLLEKVVLLWLNLHTDETRRYPSELSQMLTKCCNLKEIFIKDINLVPVSEVFTSLSNNPQLISVHVMSYEDSYHTSVELIQSIENLLRSCPKLTTFKFVPQMVLNDEDDADDELSLALRRIKDELKRPGFQFQTNSPHRSRSRPSDEVYVDASSSFFPYKVDESDTF